MRLYIFGATADGRIHPPTRLPSPGSDDASVALHSWTQTLLHSSRRLVALTPDGAVLDARWERGELVTQGDKPVGVLKDGEVCLLDNTPIAGEQGGEEPTPSARQRGEGRKGAGVWDAVAATDVGPVLAYRGKSMLWATISSPSAD